MAQFGHGEYSQPLLSSIPLVPNASDWVSVGLCMMKRDTISVLWINNVLSWAINSPITENLVYTHLQIYGSVGKQLRLTEKHTLMILCHSSCSP